MRTGYSIFVLLPVLALGLSACSSVEGLFGGGDSGVAAAPMPADARAQVRAASMRCDSISDERTWLNCYYGAAQPARAELGLQPAPQSQQSLVPR